jgi:hypothetical protein
MGIFNRITRRLRGKKSKRSKGRTVKKTPPPPPSRRSTSRNAKVPESVRKEIESRSRKASQRSNNRTTKKTPPPPAPPSKVVNDLLNINYPAPPSRGQNTNVFGTQLLVPGQVFDPFTNSPGRVLTNSQAKKAFPNNNVFSSYKKSKKLQGVLNEAAASNAEFKHVAEKAAHDVVKNMNEGKITKNGLESAFLDLLTAAAHARRIPYKK